MWAASERNPPNLVAMVWQMPHPQFVALKRMGRLNAI